MNPNSPLYRASFEAHRCARCRTHYVTIPGSLCGTCEGIVIGQARQDAVDFYTGAGKRPDKRPENATLDLFGC